jgi:hypothetical protein
MSGKVYKIGYRNVKNVRQRDRERKRKMWEHSSKK